MEADEKEGTGSKVILDLGKKSRKQVKKLRKGKGRLMMKVNDAIAELEQNGSIQPGAQVVVIVKEKKRSRGLFDILT